MLVTRALSLIEPPVYPQIGVCIPFFQPSAPFSTLIVSISYCLICSERGSEQSILKAYKKMAVDEQALSFLLSSSCTFLILFFRLILLNMSDCSGTRSRRSSGVNPRALGSPHWFPNHPYSVRSRTTRREDRARPNIQHAESGNPTTQSCPDSNHFYRQPSGSTSMLSSGQVLWPVRLAPDLPAGCSFTGTQVEHTAAMAPWPRGRLWQ